MSPIPDEATSPRATENLSSVSPTHRTLSASAEFDNVVEDIFPSEDEEEDESILIGQEIWEALEHRHVEEGGSFGWRGWLGVAAFGVISGGVILIAGNARKATQPEKQRRAFYLPERNYE